MFFCPEFGTLLFREAYRLHNITEIDFISFYRDFFFLNGSWQLDFIFLNKMKSSAIRVTPKFRFILLKILNKIMFGKSWAGIILAVVVVRSILRNIKKFFDAIFLFIHLFQKFCFQNNCINLLQSPTYSAFYFGVKGVSLKVNHKSGACIIFSSTCREAVFYQEFNSIDIGFQYS